MTGANPSTFVARVSLHSELDDATTKRAATAPTVTTLNHSPALTGGTETNPMQELTMTSHITTPLNGASDDLIADAVAAFHAVSNMETETCTIRDLSVAVVMAGAGLNEVNPREAQAALIRLGWLLVEQVDKLETNRESVFHLLHAHSGARVAS